MAYELANKCGHLLACSLHPRTAHTYIPLIKDNKGNDLHNPQKIAEAFMDFYRDLYNLKSSTDGRQSPTSPDLATYVRETALPTITGDEAEELDLPFTAEEIVQAIKLAPMGKSPGPDGFTIRFYKTLLPQLSHFLLKVFSSIDDTTPFPK